MAKGDITDVELQATLTATDTATTLANISASYTTHIDSIILTLQDGSATKRKVTIYKNGHAAANEILNIDLDPTGTKTVIISDSRIKLTAVQALFAKQDADGDVNILIQATREQIA